MNSTQSSTTRSVIVGLVVVGLILIALAGYLNPVLQATTSPLVSVQSWVSVRFTALVEFLTVPRDVASLRQQNAELESENASLQAQIIELQQQIQAAQVANALLGFAQTRPENQYVGALVIGRDPNPFMSYIILDQGSDDGVRRGMPVVTQQGLIGRISAVSASASSVQLITDPSSAVNVRLQGTDTEAIANGSITGELQLNLVPQFVTVQAGELVITSGLGGAYPPNITIGQVVTVRRQENDLFQTAVIQPVVDFSQLQAVLVITNFQPVDLSPLIQPTPAP